MKKTKTTEELIKDAPRKAPDGPVCAKCGAQAGWAGPTYRAARREDINVPIRPYIFSTHRVELTECLLYTCHTCGYVRHEPCIISVSGDIDVKTS